MLLHIDKRLREASGKKDKSFGGFFVIFVGDFQQLPPVGDTALYDGECILFESIENVIKLHESNRQLGTTERQRKFQRLLSNCQNGNLDEDDWQLLKTRFPQFARDSRDEIWNDAPRLFYRNQSAFEYNIRKLQALGTPIAKLTATHNNSAASKRDSSEANGLMAQLCLAVGLEVMLTSNL